MKDLPILLIFSLCFAFLESDIVQGNESIVLFHNDGPAVLDGPITFFAELLLNSTEDKFQYIFEDNVDRGHMNEKSCGYTCNLTQTYSSGKYWSNSYNMTIKVKNLDSKVIARNQTTFDLTDDIPGKLVISQEGYKDHPIQETVIINEPVLFKLDIYDPEGFMKNSTIIYRWHINAKKTSEKPTFNFTFTKTDVKYVSLDIFAKIKVQVGNDTFVRVKAGSYSRKIIVAAPIKVNINGSTVLKFGQVCRINVTCSGTPPFRYCWNIFNPNETVPSAYPCDDPIFTTVCQFPVVRYLAKSGSYKFVVNITNAVSVTLSQQEISILNETEERQLYLVLVPVVCSLFAIAIIVWGIGYIVHTRNRYKIEVADFDFHTKSDDNLIYKTFFERLSDSLFGVIGCCKAENSNLINGSINSATYGSNEATSSNNVSEPSTSDGYLDT